MANPMPKSQAIADLLESIYGRDTAINSDTCSGCRGTAKEFKDEKAKIEYTISGLCQSCQDDIFVPEGWCCKHGMLQDDHVCPYNQDVFNEDTVCNCCDYCTDQCNDEI